LEIDMRVVASLLAVMAASLVGAQAVQAQATDKAQQATAASSKTQSTQKATSAKAQARPGTAAAVPNAGSAKLEGVSTMRSTPVDSKKAGGCHYGDASDA
jgi:hypothetical protein